MSKNSNQKGGTGVDSSVLSATTAHLCDTYPDVAAAVSGVNQPIMSPPYNGGDVRVKPD